MTAESIAANKLANHFSTGEEIKQNLCEATDGIIVFDVHGHIRLVNEVARSYLHIPGMNLKGEGISNHLLLKMTK